MAHVLVVDDNAQVRDLLSTILSIGDHQVTEAGDGKAAMRLARKGPDLVILDLHLGGKGPTGLDVCIHLKSDPKLKEVPVLVLSGYSELEEEALAAGADAFMAKPYSPSELLARVAALLK